MRPALASAASTSRSFESFAIRLPTLFDPVSCLIGRSTPANIQAAAYLIISFPERKPGQGDEVSMVDVVVAKPASEYSPLELRLKTKFYLFAGTLLVMFLAIALTFWRTSTVPPRLEVTLVSAPKLESKLAVFHHYGPEQTLIEETQQFYHAELEFKNLGPGQIYFPYKGIFSLEIQKTNSSEWQGANQYSFSTYPPPLKVNASQTYGLRIPITAQNWRIKTSYRRWRYPVKLINFVFRDLIGTGEIFDDHKDYDFTSTVWKLPPPPTNQFTSEP